MASEKTISDVFPGLLLAVTGAVVANAIGSMLPAVSSLVAAVAIGALGGNLGAVTPTTAPGLRVVSKRVLRAGVALLGLRLAFDDVMSLGWPTLIVVAATVAATFFGTQHLGRLLGVSRDLSLLVATGFSICGASAIAAVESSTDAEEEEVAAAIGLVTLFGSLAILVLPVLSTPLGLDDVGFGMWSGASVHDVAQVVATASTRGEQVVAIAVVVKLTRVAFLAPIVAGVNLHRRSPGSKPTAVLPLFVVSFLGLVALRSTGWIPEQTISNARLVEGWLLRVALVGLGTGVQFRKLRALGPRPVALGLVAWVLVATVSYLGIRLT